MNNNEKQFYVYEYQGHIDWLGGILPAKKTFCDYYESEKKNFNKTLTEVVEAMLLSGWEGDGTIGIIWMPEFINCGTSMLWHVKQQNNGISFIASSTKLKFKDLMEIDHDNK